MKGLVLGFVSLYWRLEDITSSCRCDIGLILKICGFENHALGIVFSKLNLCFRVELIILWVFCSMFGVRKVTWSLYLILGRSTLL